MALRDLPAGDLDRWLVETALAARVDDLVRWRELAPHAARNHPTDEHLLPNLVALGAAGHGARARRLHAGSMFGSLSMTALDCG